MWKGYEGKTKSFGGVINEFAKHETFAKESRSTQTGEYSLLPRCVPCLGCNCLDFCRRCVIKTLPGRGEPKRENHSDQSDHNRADACECHGTEHDLDWRPTVLGGDDGGDKQHRLSSDMAKREGKTNFSQFYHELQFHFCCRIRQRGIGPAGHTHPNDVLCQRVEDVLRNCWSPPKWHRGNTRRSSEWLAFLVFRGSGGGEEPAACDRYWGASGRRL